LIITINRAALVRARELFERAGQAADRLTAAMPTAADAKRARRDLRSMSVAAFQSILNRIFRR
jgi:hypothetical protein